MGENAPQSYAHHTRWDPLFHFFLLPVFIVGLLMTLIHFFAHMMHSDFRDNFHAFLLILLAAALFIAVTKIRTYALRVQDRVIRLEERLRLQALAPPEWHAQINRITEDQLIALRFASDEELVELAQQAIAENLSRKQIKERIKNWRPDHWRV